MLAGNKFGKQDASGLSSDFQNGFYFTLRPTLNGKADLPPPRRQIKYGGKTTL
jgi:hypothetical protein